MDHASTDQGESIVFNHPELTFLLAGDRRADLERRAATRRLVAGGRRDRRDARRRTAQLNVIGLPPPRADRDPTGHDQRVA